jgi:hypothetical protein
MSNSRDFALARLAVAQATLVDMRDDTHLVVEHFIDPEEDKEGAQRAELLEGLEVGCHSLMQAISAAKEAMEGMDAEELAHPEEDLDEVPDDGAGERVPDIEPAPA